MRRNAPFTYVESKYYTSGQANNGGVKGRDGSAVELPQAETPIHQASLFLRFPLFPKGEVLPDTFSPPHLLVLSTIPCLMSSSSSLPPLLPSSHLS